MKTMRIALCQLNFTVGDIKGNVQKIINSIDIANKSSADIVVFGELAITGYPPEDLLFDTSFVNQSYDALETVARAVGNQICIVGSIVSNQGKLYNSAALLCDGRVIDFYYKMHLPNYGVFDEKRYFTPGLHPKVYSLDNFCFSVVICEDIWHIQPGKEMARKGASLIVCINASPYHQAKLQDRYKVVSQRCKDTNSTIAYLNIVGAQDEIVFDGNSFVVDTEGNLIAQAKAFEEDYIIMDIMMQDCVKPCIDTAYNFSFHRSLKTEIAKPSVIFDTMPIEQEIYLALVTGTRDYIRKNGFQKVCLGMSGGIDSSLVADIAVSALGVDNVVGLIMPSMYTSKESIDDALSLANALGIRAEIINITEIFDSYINTLKPFFNELPTDITEENLQARIRGNLLMAFSNKFKMLVLTTGNKSEMSVGYATLYGDMAGAFAVIKDIPKSMVYRICKWRNNSTGREIIPKNVLTKAPTAELRPNQKDTDSLPSYDILDEILHGYIEQRLSQDELVSQGFDTQLVRNVIKMVDSSEYKRRQSPLGIKITSLSFGKDRRMPITNKFRAGL